MPVKGKKLRGQAGFNHMSGKWVKITSGKFTFLNKFQYFLNNQEFKLERREGGSFNILPRRLSCWHITIKNLSSCQKILFIVEKKVQVFLSPDLISVA